MAYRLFFCIVVGVLGACGFVSTEVTDRSGVITTNGITAEVYDAAGKPVEGAEVTYQTSSNIFSPIAAKSTPTVSGNDTKTIYTDAHGIFTIQGLSTNTYSIRIQNEKINGMIYDVAYTAGTGIDTALILTQLTTLTIDFAPQYDASTVFVKLKGFEEEYTVSGNATLTIPHLPEYSYDLIFKNIDTNEEMVKEGVTTIPGEVVALDNVTFDNEVGSAYQTSSAAAQSSAEAQGTVTLSSSEGQTVSSVEAVTVSSSESVAELSATVALSSSESISSTVSSSSEELVSSSIRGQYTTATQSEISDLRVGGTTVAELLAGDAGVRVLFESGVMLKELRDNGVSNDSLIAEEIIGTFVDARDNQEYTWFTLGGYVWMAENLNYAATGSLCYDNTESNCTVAGRMYTWTVAMNNDAPSTLEAQPGVQGICPTGWHLPGELEWNQLLNDVRDISGIVDMASVTLMYKATSGWGTNIAGADRNGTDHFGFAAVPSGGWSVGLGFAASEYAFWWTSRVGPNTDAYQRMLFTNGYSGGRNQQGGAQMVRCQKDY
ncbi:MAG: hypothetical protein OCC49_08360 [Fibrobacterales bacterium]